MKPKPVLPLPDAKWNTNTCKALFDAWRGVVLIAPHQLRNASVAAKGLAEHYTREQVEKTYERMSADPYWIEKGGCDIENVANNIARELKKLERAHLQVVRNQASPTTPSSKRISSFDDENYTMDNEFYPSEAERKAAHAAR